MQIKLNVSEHLLTLAGTSMLAGGSENVDTIKVTFDSTWNGFGKLAVFNTEKTDSTNVAIDTDGIATIPSLKSKKYLRIGIVGIKNEQTYTTNVIKVYVEDGAVKSESEAPADDVYHQILSMFGEMTTTLSNIIDDSAPASTRTYSSNKIEKLTTNLNRATLIAEGKTTYGGGFRLYSMGSLLIVENIAGTLATSPAEATLFTYSDKYPAVASDQTQKVGAGISITLTANRELKYSFSGGKVESGMELFFADSVAEDTQINELTNQISDVETDVNELNIDISYILSDEPKEVAIEDLQNATFFENQNATTNQEGAGLKELNNYDTYFIVPSKDIDIYCSEDELNSSTYFAIVHGENYKGIKEYSEWTTYLCDNAIRYRKNEGTLPTIDNKLHVSEGDLLMFTIFNDEYNSIVGVESEKKINSEFINEVTNEVSDEVISKLNIEKNIMFKSGESIDISMGKSHYVFKRDNKPTYNLDTWRLYQGGLKKPDGSFFNMWNGQDAEGVLKIDGESDFIGGYHGDEIFSKIIIFIDGNEIDLSADISQTEFKNITIYVTSDIYHHFNSEKAGSKAFSREKILVFENNSVRVRNEFTALESVVASSRDCLFQCTYKDGNEEIALAYNVNTDYKMYRLSDSNYPAGSENMNEVNLVTKYGTINFKSLYTNHKDTYFGSVAYYFIESQNRIKFYFDGIRAAYPIQINENEKIVSDFIFTII